jgi:hypothetical protein
LTSRVKRVFTCRIEFCSRIETIIFPRPEFPDSRRIFCL